MKTLFKTMLLVATLSTVGCVQAHLDEPSVCGTKSADFGSVPQYPSGLAPSQTVPITLTAPPVSYDFSDPLHKITDVANNLQATVQQLVIDNSSGVFSWVRSADVHIQGSAMDGSTPMAELGTYSSNQAPGGSLSVDIKMDGATVLRYLESGQVMLSFTISGDVSPATVQPGQDLSSSVNMCVAVSGDVQKSL